MIVDYFQRISNLSNASFLGTFIDGLKHFPSGVITISRDGQVGKWM